MVLDKICMVAYPFTSNGKRIFNEIITPIVDIHTELKCVDGLSFYESKSIKMDLITKMIRKAELVIVEISEQNANVFLELGLAYAFKRNIIFLCRTEVYKEIPFDIQGKDLIIYESDNELKIKLRAAVIDSLFNISFAKQSWISLNERNHIKSSSEMEFHDTGEIWSPLCINNNFKLSYKIKIHEFDNARNPDVRLFISHLYNGYPRIGIIFPWENSEIKKDRYECHINYFKEMEPLEPGLRLQQIAVCDKGEIGPLEFEVFVSYNQSYLVFESPIFHDDISRIFIPMTQLSHFSYPFAEPQFIGFGSGHHITISNIILKEIK